MGSHRSPVADNSEALIDSAVTVDFSLFGPEVNLFGHS